MKVKKRMLMILILIVGATAAFFLWKMYNEVSRPLMFYGNVDIRSVELGFRQPGRLLTMKVEEGDKVAQGDVLASLDDAPYRDAVAHAEAQVMSARAGLEKLTAGNREQEIKVAEAKVREARVVLQQREADLKRQNQLSKQGDISPKELERIRMNRDVAAASLASALEMLSLQKEGARKEDIAAAQAQLSAAQARLAQAQTALADTVLIAPDNAIVMSRIREPGSMVTNQHAVYTLSLRNPVYIRAYIDEPSLGKIVQGGRVSIHTDSSEKVYHGQIGFISPRAEFTPKSVETTDLRTDLVYRLRITVLNGDDALKQGMPVTIRLSDAGV